MKWLVLFVVITATMLAILANTITIVGKNLIQGELHFSDSLVVWITTLFLLGTNTIVPFANRLAARFGSRLIFLIGLFLAAFGALLVTYTSNFLILAFGRWLEGAGTGFIFVVGMTSISRAFSKEQLSLALNLYLGISFGIGLGFGMFISGLFVQHASWRTAFFLISLINLLLMILTLCWFPQDSKKKVLLDFKGFLSFSIFISSLLVALMTGQLSSTAEGWRSWNILALFSISLFSLVLFVSLEKRHPDPLIPLHLFTNPLFSLSCISLFLLGMSLFSTLNLATAYLIDSLGVAKDVTGEICFIYGIAMGFGGLIGNTLIKRMPISLLTIGGLAGLIITYFWNGILSLQTGWRELMPILACRGFFIGLALGPTNVQAMEEISQEFFSAAATVLTFFRQVGSTCSGAAITIFSIRRQIFHATRWGEQINEQLPGYQTTLQRIQEGLAANPYNATKEQAKNLIVKNIEIQATIEASNDIFLLFAWVTILFTSVLILLNGYRWWKKRSAYGKVG
jgi:EmrB/QacA subfamily drug resistance transporter